MPLAALVAGVLLAPATARADPPDNIDRFPYLHLLSADRGELVYSLSIQYRLSIIFLGDMDKNRDQAISAEERAAFEKKEIESIRRAQLLRVDDTEVEMETTFARVAFPEYEPPTGEFAAQELIVPREGDPVSRGDLPAGAVAPVRPQYMRIMARFAFPIDARAAGRRQIDYIDRYHYATPGLRKFRLETAHFPVEDRERDLTTVEIGQFTAFRAICRAAPPPPPAAESPEGRAAATAPGAPPAQDRTPAAGQEASPTQPGGTEATITRGGTASRRQSRTQARLQDAINDFLSRYATDRLGAGGLALLIACCVLYGMWHALMPGHGKTLVASYLVGTRGTIGDVMILTGTVTITHTLAIWIMLAVFWLTQEQSPAWEFGLRVASGALTVLMGPWMGGEWLLAGARSADPNFHSHGLFGHAHLPGASPGAAAAGERMSRWQTVLAGILGGLIPCPTAFTAAITCSALGAPGFGAFLVVFFSVGLAGMLFVLGAGVVFTKGAARRAGGAAGRAIAIAARVARPAAALVIIVAGLLLLGITLQDHEMVDLAWLRSLQEALLPDPTGGSR